MGGALLKVLCLTDAMGPCPSFRARVVPFLPFLEKAGVSVECSVKAPKSIAPYDAIWMRRKFVPFGSEAAFSRRRLVYDFDDAMHLGGDAFRRTVTASETVLAGSSRLVREAQRAGAKRAVLLRTGADCGSYPGPRLDSKAMLWTGSQTTLRHLEWAGEALAKLVGGGASLRVVCSDRPKWRVPTEFFPWTPATEKVAFGGAAVGISPLPRDAYTLGKCAYKVVQYMAAGLPVVASDTGANREMFEECGCQGELVQQGEDFAAAASRLMSDPARMEEAGERNAEVAKKLDVRALAGTLIGALKGEL